MDLVNKSMKKYNKRISRFKSVFPDTNSICAFLKSNGPVRRTLQHFKDQKLNFIISDVVLKELSRITKFSKQEIVSSLKEKFGAKVSIVKANCDVKLLAKEIELKNPLAHYPDSILLALGKICAYHVLTYDRDMIKVANAEGVSVFSPKGGSED